MAEFLVLRLGTQPDHAASWVAVDQTGALLGKSACGSPEDAKHAAEGRQLIVLVPSLDVVRMTAEAPVRSGARLLQALPYALEEQVADDVDTLHFAAGPRLESGKVAVAVVRREAMDAWVQRLAGAGLRADRLYGDADAIGCTPNTMTLLLEDRGAILSDPDGGITAMDPDAWETILGAWIARRSTTDAEGHGPLHLVVYATPEMLDHHGEVFERLRSQLESVDLRSLSDGALPRLAAQIVTAPGINLLQGDYAERSAFSSYWPAWRLAAGLLVLLTAVATAQQLAEISRLRQQVGALDAVVDKAFHYVFPDAGPIQDARAQLSSRLRQLGDRETGASHEFLDALDVVARAMKSGGDSRIEAISYRAGTVELRVRAPTVEVLDRIQQAITAAGGLKAEIQSANASGSEVVGRLQISRPGG